MSGARVLLVLSFALLSAVQVHGQSFSGIENWRFIPSKAGVYERTSPALSSGDWASAFSAASREFEVKMTPLEELEAWLLTLKACRGAGLHACTYVIAHEIIRQSPGSEAAHESLLELEALLIERPWIERDLQRLINSGSFKEIPASLLPMVHYYLALDNSEKGLISWVPKAAAKIGQGNFWSHRWESLLAIEQLSRGQERAALQRLETLAKEKNLAPRLERWTRWQIARLKYETGDYDAAEEIYDRLPVDPVESGRVLLERSWFRKAKRDYATSLGMLEALKSPAFQTSLHPERFVLEMVNLRDLCHYGQVPRVAQQFRSSFAGAMNQIRARKPLKDNLELVRIVLRKATFDPWYQTITQIRRDRRLLKGQSGLGESLQKQIDQKLSRLEDVLRRELDLRMEDELKLEAEALVEAAEQIQLIEYLSGIDEYRIRQSFEKKDYRSDQKVGYNVFYWPVEGEHWLDELKKYRVQIGDRCQAQSEGKGP